METEKAFYERLERKGVSRRDFMKYCTFLTAAMGLSSSFVQRWPKSLRHRHSAHR